MPFEDMVFKSKDQAEKLKQVFVDRYGIKDGQAKYEEVLKRSPKLIDLPDRIEPPIKAPRKFNVSRKHGKKWRGI